MPFDVRTASHVELFACWLGLLPDTTDEDQAAAGEAVDKLPPMDDALSVSRCGQKSTLVERPLTVLNPRLA